MKQSINFSRTYQSQYKSEQTIEKVQICNKTSSRILQTNRFVFDKKNNETIQQKKDISHQKLSKMNSKFKQISKLRQIFMLMTLLQFILLFALALIQFITLQIKLPLFIVLEASLIGIHLFLALATTNADFFSILQIHSHQEYSIEQNKSANIPNQHEKGLHGQNNPVGKSSPPRFSFEGYDVNENKMGLGSQNRMNNRQLRIKMIKNGMNALILGKVLQTILSIAVPTIFLSTYEHQVSELIIVFILSLLAYLFLLVSTATSIVFIWNIHRFLENQLQPKQGEGVQLQGQFELNPSIFVDRLIKQKQSKIKSHHSIISIEKSLKSVKYVNIQNDMTSHKECVEAREKCEDNNKKSTKKSVLKSNKDHQVSKENKKVDVAAEKRRVQINQKTVQFFQYVQICPNDSAMQEKKSKAKQKDVKNKRLAQIRKKLNNETKMLQKLRCSKQRKVKSAIDLQSK